MANANSEWTFSYCAIRYSPRLYPRLHLRDGVRHQLVHLGADFLFRDRDALGGKIAHHLADDVGVAALAKFGGDHVLGIGARRPRPENPSFSAAHNPSSLLRRASALNFCSSSRANFFSKPSSRLSNVVMVKFPIRCRIGDVAALRQRPLHA